LVWYIIGFFFFFFFFLRPPTPKASTNGTHLSIYRRRTGKGARGAAEMAVAFLFVLVLYVDFFGVMIQC
jgi:hypothetical protein